MSYHKAYAAAVAAILLYILNGLMTGEWAATESISAAVAVVIMPLIVWAVPNNPKE